MSLHIEFKRDTGLKLYDPESTHPELGNSVMIRENLPAYVKWLEEKVEYLDRKIEDFRSEIIVNNSMK